MSGRDSTHLVGGRAGEEDAPAIESPAETAVVRAPRRRGGPLPFLRNIWRQLTSMRTALILLFLLGLASLPGALLPQWSLNASKTAQYILDHGSWGRMLNSLGFFEVFASPWYAAIYLLLFLSLVGCILPRTWEFVGQLRQPPVATPRNLLRLPLHAERSVAGEVDAVADRIQAGLKGWRLARRADDTAEHGITISGEKGYLREVGNLLFHLSLLGILLSVAVGKLFGYEGSIIVDTGDGFCSSSPVTYDNFRPGLLIDGTELAPFCLQVDSFKATYTEAGQAASFRAEVRYQAGDQAGSDQWQSAALEVNDPLRLSGDRVYLLGHGYSPKFTVTYPNGAKQTLSAPFQPQDAMFTSQGAVKFTDPPGYTGDEIRKHQLAVVGIFAPSAFLHGNVMTSTYPAAEQPGVAVQVFRGDLGMESGQAQSVFAIDQGQVDKGALQALNRANLVPGESMKLDDGTTVTFDGYSEWVSIQTSYDPAQGWALVSAIVLLIGLMSSLTIKRRRVWYRLRPADGSVSVEVGGLARTDQAGYGEEFDKLVALADRSP